MTDVKTEGPQKLSKKMLFFWPTRTVSIGVSAALTMYVTFYATDVMRLDPIRVGLVFMISKISDGITDIIAGYLIDRTNTKLGKARPYELALIGFWAFIVLMFSAPQMSEFAGLVYLFVMFTVINSIFVTLLNCNEAPYLAAALPERRHNITVSAVTGFVGMIFTVVASVILPGMIKEAGTDGAAWTRIALMLAIPFTIFGLIRFMTIKEVRRYDPEVVKPTMKELLYLLFNNKYIVIVSLMILLANIGTSLNVSTYYFTYIMGDLELAGPMSLAMLTIILVLVVIPPLTKRFEMRRCLQVCIFIGIVGYLIRLIDVHNFPLLLFSGFLSSLAFASLYVFVNPLIIDCMDYGEWKHGRRSEGMIASAQSVTAKVGTAVGMGMVGLLMGMSGYRGELDVQSTSAENMIIALNSVIPAVLAITLVILFQFYDLGRMLPQIHRELDERNNADKTSPSEEPEPMD